MPLGTRSQWTALPVEPPQQTLVKVTGDSGYTNHRKFLTLAYLDDVYRPRHDGPPRWLDVTNTALSDYGWEPTHWAPFDPEELP
jgi:hypothetical protein